MEEWLEPLLRHEADYHRFGATLTETSYAWFLEGSELIDLRDCNRALRLRDDGRGADAVAREVVAHFRARGATAAADVDPIAERQGVGAALRRLNVMPIATRRLLMRFSGALPPDQSNREVSVEIVPNDLSEQEMRDWVEVVTSDEWESEDLPFWRLVAERTALDPRFRLYLARLEGVPAAACCLYLAEGWGRIEDVATHPALRRRGAASALVYRVLCDTLADHASVTYLFTQEGGAGERIYSRLGFEVWGADVLRRHLLY